MKYRELIYMCSDLSKILTTDDSFFEESHIRFLLNKHRAHLLYEKYKTGKLNVPESNYHTLCLTLEESDSSCNDVCNNDTYLRTEESVPVLMNIGSHQVFTNDYYAGEITWVSKERMRYVGENRFMKNIIYASLGEDGHIYLKSKNPLFRYMKSIRFNSIFEDADAASKLACGDDNECSACNCDPLDQDFKLEEALVPQVILTVVQELTGAKFQPKDYKNDSADNLSELANFIRQNMKSPLAKQMTQ